MQGEEGHDEALQPTVGNYKKSHMQKPGRIKPIRTRPPRKPQQIGVNREQELTAISSEKPPKNRCRRRFLYGSGRRFPPPDLDSKQEQVRATEGGEREREREREREMWTIREEEDETRLRGRAREDQEGRKN